MILAEITKDTKMNIISLVKKPANKRDFLKLAEEDVLKLAFDEDLKEVTGAVLIPNQRIYRTEEFFEKTLGIREEGEIYFSAETIKELAISQFKVGNNINLDHDNDKMVEDIDIVESWLITTPEDKAYSMGLNIEDYPIGTWMCTQRINSDDLWLEVKAGNYNGFSIQANPSIELIYKGLEMKKEYDENEVVDIIVDIIKNFK